MLEKAIEIEGLLRIIRDGDPLPETYRLLNSKAASLAMESTALAVEAESRMNNEEEPKPETPKLDFVMAAPSPDAETPKVDFTAIAASEKEEPLIIQKEIGNVLSTTSPDLTEVDLDLAEEDDIILSFDDVPEQTSTTEGTSEPTVAFEDFTEQTDNTEQPDGPDESRDDDSENTPERSVAEESHTEEENKEEKEAPKRQTKLKSAFSLNDRFLYARELFNGNMKTFDSTLDFIEGIDDYALVEDYFYSELEWNPENQNVASFMETLRTRF